MYVKKSFLFSFCLHHLQREMCGSLAAKRSHYVYHFVIFYSLLFVAAGCVGLSELLTVLLDTATCLHLKISLSEQQ